MATQPTRRARMHAILARSWVNDIVHIASSTERKAAEAAAIPGAHLGLRPATHPGLGENDRSSTGYLPKSDFEAMGDAFFAHPEQSVAGRERAVDAQLRIVGAVRDVLQAAPAGDVAVVARGGVGALLLCRLSRSPISRAADRPASAAMCWPSTERPGPCAIRGDRSPPVQAA